MWSRRLFWLLRYCERAEKDQFFLQLSKITSSQTFFGMDVNLVFVSTFALGHMSLAKRLLVKSNLLDYYYLSFETSTYSKLDQKSKIYVLVIILSSQHRSKKNDNSDKKVTHCSSLLQLAFCNLYPPSLSLDAFQKRMSRALLEQRAPSF